MMNCASRYWIAPRDACEGESSIPMRGSGARTSWHRSSSSECQGDLCAIRPIVIFDIYPE